LNQLLLAKAIVGIPRSKSVPEFQKLCGITSFITVIELLNFLASKGIGKISSTNLTFSQTDKLNLLLFLLQNGCDTRFLSSKLDWKDFESFTRIILEQSNYYCKKNIHLRKPRFQIDIIGRSLNTALIVDCKDWKDIPTQKRIECAYQQRRRTEAYMKIDKNIKVGIPIVVTLNDPIHRFVERVPFIAINRLQAFLKDYDSFQEEICFIR